MRYILITGDGPEHRYVANKIDRIIGLNAIVIDSGRPSRLGTRLRQLWSRYSLNQLIGRAILAGLKYFWRDEKIRTEELYRVLRDDSLGLLHPEKAILVQGINTPQGIEVVKGLKADRLLIYGTGIVSDRILQLRRETPLNMHTGISPYYRGDSCAFWPLHENELYRLGATIHEVTSAVDGGDIYSVGQAKLRTDDTLHSVFGRCVQVGAQQYIEVLGNLEDGVDYRISQDLNLG